MPVHFQNPDDEDQWMTVPEANGALVVADTDNEHAWIAADNPWEARP